MIAVIHLVRKKEGIETFKRFIESYKRNYPEYIQHTLYLCFKGFENTIPNDYAKVIEDVRFLTIYRSDKFNALHTLRTCVEVLSESFTHIVFFNSFSEILKPNWLERMVFSLVYKGGMVSCTGSHETMCNRILYDKYPNPHIRTNAFIMNRGLFLAFWSKHIYFKWQAHAFESGKFNISKQLHDTGHFVGVVTSKGVYGLSCLDIAGSFRETGQNDNLLVADNQTRRFDDADREEQTYLHDIAWGIR